MPATLARRVFWETKRYVSRDDFVAAAHLRYFYRMCDRNRRLLRRRWYAAERSRSGNDLAKCGSDVVAPCNIIAEREFVSDADSICICISEREAQCDRFGVGQTDRNAFS